MSIQVQARRDANATIETVTPAAGEYGFDTTKNDALIGTGGITGGVRLAKKNLKESLAPAQITASTNDYSPAGLKHAGILFVNVDAAHDLTGLAPTTTGDTTDGREIEIYNTGATFALTLRNQNASSAAANRFDLGGNDIVLAPSTTVTLRYSNAETRWQLVSSTVGSSVAAAGVVARTLAASALGFSMINGTLVESHSGGAATFAIKTLAGADPSVGDPVQVLLRDATLATGDYTMMTLSSAVSLVVSSGSSLGTANSAAFRLWLVGFNDAGTFRLGVINALVGVNALLMLTPDQLASSTAEGGAGNADSSQIFYTGAAVASKPYAVLGFADYPAGLSAAGTWSASPTTLQLYQAASALPGRGVEAQIRNNGFTLINGTLVPTVVSSALTVAIKTLAGNDPSASDPVYVLFRDVTAGTGDFAVMTITAATSIVVPSTATLGAASGVAFRIWLVGFNDGGTFRLGVVNCLSGISIYPLGQFPIASSTLTPASSAQVIYTTGSAVAAKPYAVLGYLAWETGLTAAGTWAATPTRTQLFGHGVPLPGAEIQRVANVTGAVATGTTIIPYDDTVPQNTEGDQYLSQSLTVVSGANLLEVDAVLNLSCAIADFAIAALFQDAGANAINASHLYQPGNAFDGAVQIRHFQQPGVAGNASTTFKVRAGPNSATTITFNGAGGARKFGGVLLSSIVVREFMG